MINLEDILTWVAEEKGLDYDFKSMLALITIEAQEKNSQSWYKI